MSPEQATELVRLWPHHSAAEIAKLTGLSRGQVLGKSRILNLQFRATGAAEELRADHPAVVTGHTRFPDSVRAPGELGKILRPGSDSRKLGSVVQKGPWAGMPIYSLTLEERATCPDDCALYRGCYGNAMQLARRIAHGPELERRLEIELDGLRWQHPMGFAVRLHMLGDFFSVGYVDKWSSWLRAIPHLRVFGYTARKPDSLIGKAIVAARAEFWPRFMIRLSSTGAGHMRAITLAGGEAPPPHTIVCPAETGLGRSCATCALCWSESAQDKTIAFVLHGAAQRGRKRAAP
jgi:hypothetical protein